MKYLVKFLSKETNKLVDDKLVYTINPKMNIKEAQRILRDLKLMGITAWVEEEKNEL